MRKASHSVIFINTSPPAERVELLKPCESEIENLSDDCEEIQSGGLLKRYTKHPECMQNITLADWAAWYDSCGEKGYRKTNKKCDVDNLLLQNEEEESDDELLNDNPGVSTGSKELKKRTRARIIHSVWVNKEAQPEKHYCELMLFTSWQNEETDLLKTYSTFEEHYLARRDEISEQMQQYAICSKDLNEVRNHLQESDDDAYDIIAPVTQDVERQDEDEGCTDTHPDLNETFDHLSDNLGIHSTQQNNEPLIFNEMQDDEYQGSVQMLNKKQRIFLSRSTFDKNL